MAKRILSGYSLIRSYLGVILILIGCVILLPLLVLIGYPQEIQFAKCFLIPGLAAIVIGFAMSMLIAGHPKEKLERNHDAIIITTAWIMAILISTVPFVLSGQTNFLHALFECTSGYATVGLSVIDVTTMPHIFLLFRSIMLLFGGIGLILVVTCVMSGYYGMKLYQAEGHSDRIMPNLINSARVIIAIYLCYILIGSLAYMHFGMNNFDAVNHAISALATGGFSTKTNSIAYYASPQIEYVLIILMLLGSISFILHLAVIKGEWRRFIKHCETKLMFWMIVISTPIVAFLLLDNFTEDVFRTSLLHVVSAMTTTGFSTVSMTSLSVPIILILVVLMTFGGGVGSTAGGIKQYRIDFIWNIKSRISSNYEVRPNTIDKFGESVKVEDEEKLSIGNFALLYLMLLVMGTFIISCYGYPLKDSLLVVEHYQAPTEKITETNHEGYENSYIKEGQSIYDKTVNLPCDYSAVSEYIYKDGEIGEAYFEETILMTPKTSLNFEELHPSEFRIYKITK